MLYRTTLSGTNEVRMTSGSILGEAVNLENQR